MRNTGSGVGSQTCKVMLGTIKLSAHPSEGQEKNKKNNNKKENKQYLGPNSVTPGA